MAFECIFREGNLLNVYVYNDLLERTRYLFKYVGKHILPKVYATILTILTI